MKMYIVHSNIKDNNNNKKYRVVISSHDTKKNKTLDTEQINTITPPSLTSLRTDTTTFHIGCFHEFFYDTSY